MAQLAIKGHATSGKEVIEILEMLGGKNPNSVYSGKDTFHYYYIDNETGYITTKLYTDNCLTKLIYNIFTFEEFLEKFPYKVGDKVIDIKTDRIAEIYKAHWSESRNCTYYDLKLSNNTGFVRSYKFLKPYKEETMESKPNLLQQLKEYFDNTPRDVLEKEWNELSYLNEIGPTVDEYLECVKKYRQSNQYPKTYKECCEVLGCKADDFFTNFGYNGCDVEVSDYEDKIDDLLQNFRKLRYCRDAYWKIAGEQMGLGKPWIPLKTDNVYCIFRLKGEIVKDKFVFADSLILEFPTEEMRDTFYENFKELIEIVKELI